MERPINTRMVLVTVSLSLMTVMSAVSGLSTALPDIAVSTSATQTQLTWIVDSYTVVFAGLLLLAGAIGDRHGRRLTLTAGLTLFAVTSAAGLFADTSTELIALRVLSGIGAAAIMPSTLSVITTSFPPEERGKAVGVWVGVAGGGAILGLFGTAALLEFYSWNSFFALNLVLALVGLGGTLRYVPESRGADGGGLDWVGGGLSVLTVGGLVFGIIEGADQGWGAGATTAGLAVGVLSLLSFVLWELRAAAPLLDPRLFRDRAFSAGALSITVQFFAQFGFVYVAVQYLQFVAGFTPLQAALRLLPMAFVVLPASRLAGSLDHRVPQKYLGSAGLLLLGIGLYVMGQEGTHFDVWFFWLGLSLYAFGVAFAATPATSAITSALPDDKQGVASAVNDTARELGSAVGIAVLGAVLTATYKAQIAPVVAHLPAPLGKKVELGLSFTKASPPAQYAHLWQGLVHSSFEAFVVGMERAMTIGAGVAVIAAIFVLVLAPTARQRRPLSPQEMAKSRKVVAGSEKVSGGSR